MTSLVVAINYHLINYFKQNKRNKSWTETATQCNIHKERFESRPWNTPCTQEYHFCSY